MSTYFWSGGAHLWTEPDVFFGPEILSGPDAGTFPPYPGPPGPGDVVFLSNAPTLDNVAIVGETIEINVTHSEVADTIQDSSFDGSTTFDVSGNGFWSNSVFGSVTTAAIMNVGNPGTYGEANFLLGQTTDSTATPSMTNSGVINIVNGDLSLADGHTIDGSFINTDVVNIQNAGPSVSALADNLTSGTNGFINDGIIAINGEGAASNTLALGFFGDGIGGTGTISITDGKLDVQAVSSGQSITFRDANGLLILGTDDLAGDTFQASIDGFRPGDTIDLGTAASSVDPSQVGLINVDEGVETIGTLKLTAQFGQDKFALAQDASNGHGLLEMVAACYAAGARLLTGAGEVAVEDLRPGDRMVTMLARRLAPVRWIGHRRIDLRGLGRRRDLDPVRVRAHAFGAGRPHADLLLSPDHAVFVDGFLVPVRYLLNGATVVQEQVEEITYYHLELAEHEVLLAHGLPAESYLDTGNRCAFANGGAVVAAVPEFARRIWRARACAPLLTEGPHLVAVRTRLLAQAAALGHATTRNPDLRLFVDGVPVRPMRDGARWRVRLPSGVRGVRLVSRSFVPAEIRAGGDDHRRLGVAIAGLAIDGQRLALGDPRLNGGWHAPEAMLRWTDGDASVRVDGARELELDIAAAGRYWRQELISASMPG